MYVILISSEVHYSSIILRPTVYLVKHAEENWFIKTFKLFQMKMDKILILFGNYSLKMQ